MLFNPFKYQYEAIYLGDEGTAARTRIRKGTLEEELLVPKSLLPLELKAGDPFVLSFQSQESAQQGEAEALKKLLEDLIR